MGLRRELVDLALAEGANRAELARRFEVSRKTAYKWLSRYRAGGVSALADQSRRPHRFRQPTPAEMERAVLAVRQAHQAWGGRKIKARLKHQGHFGIPSASTITAILHRHDLIDPRESAKRQELTRFERAQPNELWQMDFKGEFKLGNGQWCYPLTVLDDHSRYSLGVRACGDQKGLTVREHLIDLFRHYGLPGQMLMDHGKPWCTAHSYGGWTQLSVWLLRLDIGLTHGRVCHPQTQGKEERFHRTFKAELKPGPWLVDLPHAQGRFDPWRESYNCERPHEALDMLPPASRYRLSPRRYPQALPEVTYGPDDQVRSINPVGQFSFQGRIGKTSEAFRGERIGMRPTVWDGVFEVYYSRHRIGWLDLRSSRARASVPVQHLRPQDLRPPEADAANDAAV
jgi:transposase InsO family protein